MTNVDERLFMLDLAIVQLIASILITLGSTLFAISIGFGLAIPTAMREAVSQMLFLNSEISPEVQLEILEESLSNYVLILALVGVVLIATGIVFASAKTVRIRKQIKASRHIRNLLASDISGPLESQTHQDSKPSAPRHKDHRNGIEESDSLDTNA